MEGMPCTPVRLDHLRKTGFGNGIAAVGKDLLAQAQGARKGRRGLEEITPRRARLV